MGRERSPEYEFGGKLRVTMPDDLFPMDQDDGRPDRMRVVSQLTKAQHDDLEFVVACWNEMHKALGRKGRGWAIMSVAQRMVIAGIASFLTKHGGRPSWLEDEPPMTAEERAAVMKRAVEDVVKAKTKKRK